MKLKCGSHGRSVVSNITPLKINMEDNHGGLENCFPFQMGDLSCRFHVNVPECICF